LANDSLSIWYLKHYYQKAAGEGDMSSSSSSDASGLRQRKGSTDSKQLSTEETTENYLKMIEASAPAFTKPYLAKVAPVVIMCASCVSASIPMIHYLYEKALEMKVLLEPFHLDALLPAFLGFIMCFFGGSYMTLIAAAEAYRMVGWETQVKCIRELSEDFTRFLAANKQDDSVDADGDGVADTSQISKSDLMTRKTLLFLKTVDPKRLSEALGGLQSGFLAVVATLKLQFAKAITLGTAIGDILMKPANSYVVPVVERVLPDEYRKWAGPIVSYLIKSFAISTAWFLQRIISAFHSAMRGGTMFSRNVLEYLDRMKVNRVYRFTTSACANTRIPQQH